MKLRRLTGMVAGLLSLGLLAAGSASAAGPATVHVRVEGTSQTLVNTRATTVAAPVNKDGQPGHDCSGTSALGSLDRATGGEFTADWDAMYNSYIVRSIKGELHTAAPSAAAGEYWSFWLNYRFSDAGLCDAQVQEGDDVLLFPDCFGSTCVNPTPLRISNVPGRPRPGDAAAVKVEEFTATFDPGSSSTVTSAAPSKGATVTAGGRTYTTGDDGTAQVTFDARGEQTVQATKPGHIRTEAVQACVSDGSDGACGTTVPCATSGHDGRCGTTDREAPRARITSIRNGASYARKKAPRTLRGTVTADPSGLSVVKLRLRRRVGRDCTAYDGRRERFRARSCYRNATWFGIGDREDWSYLLPARLARGRYTLDVHAVDRAGNRAPRARVVFRVR
jgi:hypothetical protein